MESDRKTLEEPAIPGQYHDTDFYGDEKSASDVCEISMIVQPDGPTYLAFSQALELSKRLIGGNPPHVVGMSIVCDSCCSMFPHSSAEKYSCRRKCSKCKRYYDICNECIANTETCPMCHEVDAKW